MSQKIFQTILPPLFYVAIEKKKQKQKLVLLEFGWFKEKINKKKDVKKK